MLSEFSQLKATKPAKKQQKRVISVKLRSEDNKSKNYQVKFSENARFIVVVSIGVKLKAILSLMYI